MSRIRWFGLIVAVVVAMAAPAVRTSSDPVVAAKAMVVSQDTIASQVGVAVMREGGNAVDAAVATAFALAVVHPSAGNLGGGGFLVYRLPSGEAVAFDFREMAPARAHPSMFLTDGKYDSTLHHNSYLAVGVPGTVAGLHMAWKEYGRLPWTRLVEPAVRLARDGFVLTEGLASANARALQSMKPYPASVAQFSKNGVPFEAGEVWTQPDLALTLSRIATLGPAGFYEGPVAARLAKDMADHGGLITEADLKAYRPERRTPLRGTYRGYDIVSMPPISSGGTALLEMLNILEAFDVAGNGFGSARNVHVTAEAMRRAFADRARFLGDPAFNPQMPIARLISKDYAATLRSTIALDRVSASSPTRFEWPHESDETTHFSVVDDARGAVSLTYTLEAGYGSKIIAPGTGFLLNNEMGDFNAGPGLTDAEGLIGTEPNLAQPGKRMLSSMTPTIVAKDGALFMVTGGLGGRTIINTVLHTILNVVDYGMNAQESVDAPRFHHQWLPDRIQFERHGLSPDTQAVLQSWGHTLVPVSSQGVAEVVVVNRRNGKLEGGVDRRMPDGGAVGY